MPDRSIDRLFVRSSHGNASPLVGEAVRFIARSSSAGQAQKKNSGFTLVELIVVIALLGVLSAIGIPMYQGYADTARVGTVQNNLRAVYLQQQEYLTLNNAYYSTGATCTTDQRTAINTHLFGGEEFLKADGYRYCVLQADPMAFEARAEEASGSRVFSITHENVEGW